MLAVAILLSKEPPSAAALKSLALQGNENATVSDLRKTTLSSAHHRRQTCHRHLAPWH